MVLPLLCSLSLSKSSASPMGSIAALGSSTTTSLVRGERSRIKVLALESTKVEYMSCHNERLYRRLTPPDVVSLHLHLIAIVRSEPRKSNANYAPDISV